MSFLKATTSFTRFHITDPVPQSLWNEILDRLRQFSFKDIDEIPEQQSYGWVSFEDMLDTQWESSPVEKGVYLAFSFRLDTRRVPPSVIKKHLCIAIKREETQNLQEGKKFISRERKKELREQVMLKLRMRFLPIPAEFQVIWDTTTNILYFTSTQQKMLDMFQEFFIKTFDLHLEAMTPYSLAATIIKDVEVLDSIEPTDFA